MKQKKKMTLQERMAARFEQIDEVSGYGKAKPKKKVAKKKATRKKAK